MNKKYRINRMIDIIKSRIKLLSPLFDYYNEEQIDKIEKHMEWLEHMIFTSQVGDYNEELYSQLQTQAFDEVYDGANNRDEFVDYIIQNFNLKKRFKNPFEKDDRIRRYDGSSNVCQLDKDGKIIKKYKR